MNTTKHLEIANTIIAQLVNQHPQLVAAINTLAADGYPTNSGQGAKGKNTISDPTAHAALEHNEAGQDRARLQVLVIRLRDITFELDNLRAKYLNPRQTQTQIKGPTPCANMYGCPDNNNADQAGRCQTCLTHLRANNRDRR